MSKNASMRGFIIYDFFYTSLKLSPTEQLIYGLIYSFTENGKAFSGSHRYLSQRTGMSEKTVGRALRALLERGLIKKRRLPCRQSTFIYTAVLKDAGTAPPVPDTADMAPEDGASSPAQYAATDAARTREAQARDGQFDREEKIFNTGQNVPVTHPICPYDPPKLSDNNKYTINSTIKPSSSSSSARTRESERGASRLAYKGAEERTDEPRDEPYRIRYVGRERVIMMTAEQYNSLLDLVGDDVLDDYIARVEQFIQTNPGGGAYVHSYYHTIRKWIAEDFSKRGMAATPRQGKKKKGSGNY